MEATRQSVSAKRRASIPKSVKDAVLREYRHRCAVCGGDRPHLHHIDEDPSNNEPGNLIPLCPNHHLTDQHDPTAAIDHRRLRLFRDFKDPMILAEQFVPLWRRCSFILDAESVSGDGLDAQARELTDFVAELKQGKFYAGRLRELVGPFAHVRVAILGDGRAAEKWKHQVREDNEADRKKIIARRDEALSLVVELLRYQDWTKH